MPRLRCSLLLLIGAPAFAQHQLPLPTGDDWLNHLKNDLLPFWSIPAALGNPLGSFPSTRCDDGSLLDFQHPCAPIAGNAYLMLPAQYLVPLSRQTYGYGVAFHLTGDPKYLDWMKAGIAYIRQNTLDPSGGMYTVKDLMAGSWGPPREFRDPQQLGYGLLGLAFYYYLTRDDAVLPDILAVKNYIERSYWNSSLGTNQWLLQSNGGTPFDQKELVADLDQVNTYLMLLTPILPEPSAAQWKQTLANLMQSMLGTFYSPRDNLFFLAANTPRDRDLAFTGVDYGHTSKALWMARFAGQALGDQGLFQFASAAARRHLDRAFIPEDGSWAEGVLQGAATDKSKNWWVYAELDQLAGTLAMADGGAPSGPIQYLPSTNTYWFEYFVDHQFGEVWNGVNYGTNTPQRDYPKSWQWKSAYHDFEHALVGYISAQQLHQQPYTLHYAFTKNIDPATIHPYYFSGVIDSIHASGAYQDVTFHGTQPAAAPALTVVSSASSLPVPQAPESIATAWGAGIAENQPSVSVTDSTGTTRQGTVFYSSITQVNFQIPAGTAPGNATIAVTGADGKPLTGTAQIANAQPGIFELNASTALAAAEVVRVKADGTQTLEPVYMLRPQTTPVARPIDLGLPTDQVYLSLFTTGVRNASTVTATVGGQKVALLYSGPQGTFAGLDQVNIGPLPRSLAGAGKSTIVLVADGQTANPVEVVFQ